MGQTRAHERKAVTLSVKCKSTTAASDLFREHAATDVSNGGLFVAAKQPLPVGTLMRFELDAGEGEVVSGVGKVAWQRGEGASTDEHRAGMGVQFVRMDAGASAQIARLVREG